MMRWRLEMGDGRWISLVEDHIQFFFRVMKSMIHSNKIKQNQKKKIHSPFKIHENSRRNMRIFQSLPFKSPKYSYVAANNTIPAVHDIEIVFGKEIIMIRI